VLGVALLSGLRSIRRYLAWRRSLGKRAEAAPVVMFTPTQMGRQTAHARRLLGWTPDKDREAERHRELARTRFLRAMRGSAVFIVLVSFAVFIKAI
jgi:hypothetical protein